MQSGIATTRRLEDRILKLLEQRSGNLEETIRVEHELSRIRGEAERMEGRLRYLTDRTTLATVTITARKSQNYTPPESPNFARRLQDSFAYSWASLVETGQDLAVSAAKAAPWLAVGLVFMVPAAVIMKRRWRIFRRNRE